MQSLCNAKKNCKANCKCLQQNQFKLILLQTLAIFSRNFFFSLTIERLDVLFSNFFQIFIAHPFLRGYTTTTFRRLQCNYCIAAAWKSHQCSPRVFRFAEIVLLGSWQILPLAEIEKTWRNMAMKTMWKAKSSLIIGNIYCMKTDLLQNKFCSI